MKYLLLILLASQIYAENFYEIPKKYSKSLFLDLPKDKQITLKDQLKFKGSVPKEFKITINNKPIKVVNGTFEANVSLTKLGKQTFKVTFENNTDRIHLTKQIIKLKNSNSIVLSQNELGFINTSFVSDNFKKRPLNQRLLRDELAYFASQITTRKTEKSKAIKNKATIKRYKKEIQSVVDNNILSLDANGNFKSSDSVSTIVFLATISKAFDLKPSSKEYSEIKNYKGKWFYDFLTIGLDQGIISSSSLKNITKPITHATFAKLSTRIKALKYEINEQLTFKDIVQPKQTYSKAPSIQVNIEVNSVTKISETMKKIDLKLNTTLPFVSNWKKIIPTSDGHASIVIPINQETIRLDFGSATFVQSLPKLTSKKVTKTMNFTPVIKKQIEVKKKVVKQPMISPYSDLNNHWVKNIANELKQSGKLANTKSFNPNKKISRSQLAKYLVEINGVKSKGGNKLLFKDLKPTDKSYPFVQAVVSNKLLKGVTTKQFGGNKKVTKLQALVAVSRLLPDTPKANDVNLPFKDISKYKWAASSIKKAYHYKVISPAKQLNPTKEITNAELVTLLYKASVI